MGYKINRSDEARIYRTKLDKCPYCGKIFDSASEIFKDGPPPVPGDMSVCFQCGGFLEFTEKLFLSKLSLRVFTSLTLEERSSLIANLESLIRYQDSMGINTITFNYNEYLNGFYE